MINNSKKIRNLAKKIKWILFCPKIKITKHKIKQRTILMFNNGLIKEVLYLKKVLNKNHIFLSTMGYKEADSLYQGYFLKKQAIKNTINKHYSYAKKQITWFQKESWWQQYIN